MKLHYLLPILLIIIVGLVVLNKQSQNTPLSETLPTAALPSPSIDPDANIRVTSPRATQILTLPIIIEGEARVFENQLNYRVSNCEGNVLTEGIVTAESPDMGLFGPFRAEVRALPEPQGRSGCIEVFSGSPKDGSEINMVKVPVSLNVSDSATIKVFFSREETGGDCTSVFSVKRFIASTQAPARLALEELLRGPVWFEKQNGFDTSINSGVRIQKLTIKDGTAYVDFDETLQQAVGGSCRVSVIRSQITQTLLQFPTVKKVVISIDGRTEDILQP